MASHNLLGTEGENAVETTTQNIKYMAGKTAYSYEFDVPLGESF